MAARLIKSGKGPIERANESIDELPEERRAAVGVIEPDNDGKKAGFA